MTKGACVAPIAFLRLVGAGHIDGIEAVIVPDRGRDQADFELASRCLANGCFLSLI